jgi:hypothetical protein
MSKAIRRVLPKDEREYKHQWDLKHRSRQPAFESDRYVSADRLLGNPALVQLLSLKLQTEGEQATVDFLKTLGCFDVDK